MFHIDFEIRIVLKLLAILLTFQGIINMENRKEWPLNILKKVLEELMSETPKDLLAK